MLQNNLCLLQYTLGAVQSQLRLFVVFLQGLEVGCELEQVFHLITEVDLHGFKPVALLFAKDSSRFADCGNLLVVLLREINTIALPGRYQFAL